MSRTLSLSQCTYKDVDEYNPKLCRIKCPRFLTLMIKWLTSDARVNFLKRVNIQWDGDLYEEMAMAAILLWPSFSRPSTGNRFFLSLFNRKYTFGSLLSAVLVYALITNGMYPILKHSTSCNVYVHHSMGIFSIL